MDRLAELSSDSIYRYSLHRYWNDSLCTCMFIMCNPSTADANVDDPTIRKCIKFATRWGYGGIAVYNLFGLRATDPMELKVSVNPFGDNERYLQKLLRFKPPLLVVCAWGRDGKTLKADMRFQKLLKEHGVLIKKFWCLGTNQDGTPKHPLYLRDDTELVLFEGLNV